MTVPLPEMKSGYQIGYATSLHRIRFVTTLVTMGAEVVNYVSVSFSQKDFSLYLSLNRLGQIVSCENNRKSGF